MASHKCSSKWIPSPLPNSGAKPGPTQAIQPRAISSLGRIALTLQLYLVVWTSELFLLLFARFLKGNERSLQSARRIRILAERLGSIWVSLARLISLRRDLLGVEFCAELARARDYGVPLPFPIVRKCVKDELQSLGKSFDEVFSTFSSEPLATRSFGQFHRARLRENDQEVVVRVRAPDALKQAQLNWQCMRVSFFIGEKFHLMPHLRLQSLLYEVKKYTDNLLDFRTQVSPHLRIRRILRRHGIYVPGVYKQLCTERLMVTEFVDAPSIAQLEELGRTAPELCTKWLSENGVDRRKLWHRLFSAHQQLLFEHNLFYTDLSAFTITVLRGNRLAFVGYNVIGTLDAILQQRYKQLHDALLESDYSKVSDLYLLLGPPLPHTDISNMRIAVSRALRKWESWTHVKTRPYKEKSIAAALGSLARCTSEQKLPTSWSLARLHLAERNLDQSLGFLDPTRNCIKAMGRYRRQAERRSIKKLVSKKSINRFKNTLGPARIAGQIVENVQNNAQFFRQRLLNAQAGVSKLSAIGGRMIQLVAIGLVWALALDTYLHFEALHDGALPPFLQNTVGNVIARLRLNQHMAWGLGLLGVLIILRFLHRLARQLLAREGGPAHSS